MSLLETSNFKCRLPDNGSRMVQCTGCLKWYHVKCAVRHEDELKSKDCNVEVYNPSICTLVTLSCIIYRSFHTTDTNYI